MEINSDSLAAKKAGVLLKFNFKLYDMLSFVTLAKKNQ